jgi:hypothetical protein
MSTSEIVPHSSHSCASACLTVVMSMEAVARRAAWARQSIRREESVNAAVARFGSRDAPPPLTAAPHPHSVSRGHVMLDQVTFRGI